MYLAGFSINVLSMLAVVLAVGLVVDDAIVVVENVERIMEEEKLDAFHFRNWFDAIRKGTKLNSGIVDACISTQLVQLGNIAQRVGHSLQIDPGSGRILNDLEANKLWGREYEKGWEIRV